MPMYERLRNIPLNVAVIAPFAVLALVAVTVAGAVYLRSGRSAAADAARVLRDEASAHVKHRIDTILRMPHHINAHNVLAMEKGVLHVDDTAATTAWLLRQIDIHDSVSSIYFGNARGGLVNGGREPGSNIRYTITTEGLAAGTLYKDRVDAAGRTVAQMATVAGFDARTRPWYTRAVAEGGPVWSPIYVLSTGQDMAVAASRPVYDAGHRLLGVWSVDLFLTQLSQFLQTLKISRTGQCFIMDREGKLVATSVSEALLVPQGTGGRPVQRRAADSISPVTRQAVRTMVREFGSPRYITQGQNLTFEAGGLRYLLGIRPIHTQGIDWLIAVVVSESDFYAKIHSANRFAGGVMASALAATILLGWLMLRGVTRPMRRLRDAATEIADGRWQVSLPEGSRYEEIDKLTRAFGVMTGRLRSTMDDLEREIGERRAAEQILIESEARQRLLFDGSMDAMFVHRLESDGRPGAFIQVNDEACRRLGYSREQLLQMTPTDIGEPGASDRLEPVAERLRKEGSVLFETVHISADGRRIDVESHVRLMKLGTETVVLSISRDISARKRAEMERASLAERLQKSRKEKSLARMAGAVAHHFNNTLTVVHGNLEMALEDVPTGSSLWENLSEADAACRRASEMSKLMLDYLGQSLRTKKPLEIARICREAMHEAGDGLPDGIILEGDLAAAEGVEVQAVADHVRQVVDNLLVNAVESLDSGPGRVSVSLSRLAAANLPPERRVPHNWRPVAAEYLCLAIADTGPGMASEALDNIFDPFFSTKFTGRGLGLSVALGLVKVHDGSMAIDSAPGRGTVVRVYWPVSLV